MAIGDKYSTLLFLSQIVDRGEFDSPNHIHPQIVGLSLFLSSRFERFEHMPTSWVSSNGKCVLLKICLKTFDLFILIFNFWGLIYFVVFFVKMEHFFIHSLLRIEYYFLLMYITGIC
ncbi:unnamed protein product, partial [Cuscuta europaea]